MPDPAYQPSAASRKKDLTGTQVGRFIVHDRLGSGGMGEVYRAEDTKLRRTVAIKRLSSLAGSTENEVSRLLREGQRASALNHPNIAGVYDVLEDNGEILLVMEYVQGQTLRERLTGPIKAEEFLPIAVECASALAAAHEKGILHSDIKPENIMLTPDGHVKLLDFGVARRVATADDPTLSMSMHNLSVQGAIGGTPAYMAPEILLGGVPDLRADVFSLGLVFYEMLSGKHPYSDPVSTTPPALRMIQQATPPPLPKLDSRISQPIAAVITKCLQRDPVMRYSSAKPLYDDVLSIAEGTRPKFAAIAKPSRRGRAMVLFALLAIAVAMGIGLMIPAVRNKVGAEVFAPSLRHIAVLPIDAIGNNPNDATLADGLMESMTSKLSNLEVGNESLWVVPATEVRRKKVTDPTAALKTLGANLVVTGTLQRDGNNVRLIVNLVDAKTMRQLGSGEFQDRAGDFSAVQDSAVTKLANLMKIPLTRDMLHNTGGSVVPAAYESYLKGLGFLNRYDKPGNLDQAVAAFNEATKTDPNFAVAFAGLGEAYLMKFKTTQDSHLLDEASASAVRALQINDQLAPTHVTMGRINDASGKHALALQEFQRALELEPHNADALLGVAAVYENEGRLKDAEDTYKRAAALRPDYWEGYNRLGRFYYNHKRYPEAIVQFDRVIALTPDNVAGYLNEGATYVETGDLDKAANMLNHAVTLSPNYGIYANLGQIYYQQGRYEEAAHNTEEALKLNDKDYRVWVNLALAYRKTNKDAQALNAYRQALVLLEPTAAQRLQDAGMQAQLAELYAYLHQREKAIPKINAALALSPNDPEILVRAADVFDAVGEHRKAVEYALQALKRGYPAKDMALDPEARALVAEPALQSYFKGEPNRPQK
jgi:eukaryotic-like serine/threonine-protein kinase